MPSVAVAHAELAVIGLRCGVDLELVAGTPKAGVQLSGRLDPAA